MADAVDLTATPHGELEAQALRSGVAQYRALDELARRVRETPADWLIDDWSSPLSRPPAPHEIELAFLHLSQYANETDGEFSCSQDARIRELEERAEVSHDTVTEYMNRMVARGLGASLAQAYRPLGK